MALLNWPCKTLCSLPCQLKARAKSTTTDQQHQGMNFIFCVYFKSVSVFLPAVCHYRPSIRGVEELDLTYESKQSGGITGNAMVGPAGEMKLTEFTDLMMGLLNNTHTGMMLLLNCIFYDGNCWKWRPFCLLMMTNTWMSQVLSWPLRERLTRRHIMVQQTNL